MSMVAATFTQPNSLNQDINGINGGINASTTWQSLGAFTQTYALTSITPVPEPGIGKLSSAWLGFGLLALIQQGLRRVQ
jgi:hypothetical protein